MDLKPRWVVAEAWASECRLKNLETWGIVFIVIGFSMLVLGVIFEWAAQKLRSKWIANGMLLPSFREKFRNANNDPQMPKLHGKYLNQSQLDVFLEKESFIENQLPAHRSQPFAAPSS